ncbi:MAG: malto-oligosyltrehalose trehalohydrolase [Pirellulales bacterium]
MHFRVWAPRRQNVVVELRDASNHETLAEVPLAAEDVGYFSGYSASAKADTRYGFRLDGESKLFPDPASRRQPDGPHGLSEIVDPARFPWSDGDWPGVELVGQVIYEMHVGTFTAEGTWNSAARELPALADLGVTMVEVMPVAEFDGEFGWGYDGVDLFAPTRNYGTPDDFRRFVDEAHRHGLGVMLDVVSNHLGPVGNYLGQFSSDYFSRLHHTGWGEAINYDGENSGPVREFFISNAGYWIDEFHVDGLRLDAVHAIVDDSPEHIVAALARHVRRVAGKRKTLVIAENEFQQSYVMREHQRGGYGLDAGWNDDFHHVARVAATGHAEYYFGDYQGTPQEFISLVKWGHLYQGQWNARQKRLRGSPGLDLDAARFVNFLENHDQVGNSPGSRRAHELTSPGRHRALTALLCLAPGTPLLFQGQEFSANSPFFFFADHEPELATLVRQGRQAEMRKFGRQAGPATAQPFADPADRRTFERSKLDLRQREQHPEAYLLHRDLLRLRRVDRVFSAQRSDRIHGAVIAAEAFLLRYLGEEGDDRLVLVNLGRDLEWSPAAEPLLVPPAGRGWRLLWSSEDPRYGGLGTPPLDAHRWFLPGHATVVLTTQPA